jgi:hypothetical protein
MPASYTRDSKNVKLSRWGRGVDATYASIRATCPTSCALRDKGCYAQGGNVALHVRRLDTQAGEMTPIQAARYEAATIDDSWGRGRVPEGQLLRLHVSGDARTVGAARTLAAAAARWIARGGRGVWSYTHAWKAVRRGDWGPVSVLASVESPTDALAARERGYAPAIVVPAFPSGAKSWESHGVRWIPCPAQAGDRTCEECRLCVNDEALLARGAGIAFEAHGAQASSVKRRLPVVQ